MQMFCAFPRRKLSEDFLPNVTRPIPLDVKALGGLCERLECSGDPGGPGRPTDKITLHHSAVRSSCNVHAFHDVALGLICKGLELLSTPRFSLAVLSL